MVYLSDPSVYITSREYNLWVVSYGWYQFVTLHSCIPVDVTSAGQSTRVDSTYYTFPYLRLLVVTQSGTFQH